MTEAVREACEALIIEDKTQFKSGYRSFAKAEEEELLGVG
jgi:hypothetical protein